MEHKDLDKLSLGLCLMVFSFDLIVFSAVASMGAFIIFQVANKYSIKQLKIYSALSITAILTSYFLVKFSNVPSILLLKVFASTAGVFFLYKVFTLSIPYLIENVYDEKINEKKLSNNLKVIIAADLVYVVITLIPLLGYVLNIDILTNLSSLLIRSDVATSILFILLIIKYLFSKSYRDLNFIHRQYSMDDSK